MSEHQDLHVPHAELPPFLRGLRPPVSTDEAIAYAEAHGAPPEALRFIESLPAAVFSSESGMRHAFSTLAHRDLPETDPEHVLVAEDGTTD